MFALPAVKWVAGGAGAAAVAGAAVFVAAFVLSSDEATAPEGPAPPISLFPVELVNRSVTPTLDPETLPTWARNTLEVEELGTADAADALQRASQHIGIDIAIARDFADSDLGLYKIDFFDDSDGRRVILYFDTFSADATQQKTTAVFINPGVVEPGSPYEDYAIGGDYRAKWTEGQQPGSAFQRRLWVTNGEYQVLINSMGPNALTLDEAARLARTLFE